MPVLAGRDPDLGNTLVACGGRNGVPCNQQHAFAHPVINQIL